MVLYILSFFGFAFLITSSSAQSCGKQICEFRECVGQMANKTYPGTVERFKKTYEEGLACYAASGCENPETASEDHGEEKKEKSQEEKFGMCLIDNVVEKVIFPQMEACIREKYMVDDYELPQLNHFFQGKEYGKAAKEMMMILAAGDIHGKESFDIENPATAWYVVFLALEHCPNDTGYDAARKCLEGVAKKYWTNPGKCVTPIQKAINEKNKFRTYCVREKDCYKKLDESCLKKMAYEPKFMCGCAYSFLYRKSIQKAVMKGLAKCFNITEQQLMEDERAMYWLMDFAGKKLWYFLQEFCSLEHKSCCMKYFKDMNPIPKPKPKPTRPPKPTGKPRPKPTGAPKESKRPSIFDRLKKVAKMLNAKKIPIPLINEEFMRKGPQ